MSEGAPLFCPEHNEYNKSIEQEKSQCCGAKPANSFNYQGVFGRIICEVCLKPFIPKAKEENNGFLYHSDQAIDIAPGRAGLIHEGGKVIDIPAKEEKKDHSVCCPFPDETQGVDETLVDKYKSRIHSSPIPSPSTEGWEYRLNDDFDSIFKGCGVGHGRDQVWLHDFIHQFFTDQRHLLGEEIKKLIIDEINICQQEDTPTSRLTSLYMKVLSLLDGE